MLLNHMKVIKINELSCFRHRTPRWTTAQAVSASTHHNLGIVRELVRFLFSRVSYYVLLRFTFFCFCSFLTIPLSARPYDARRFAPQKKKKKKKKKKSAEKIEKIEKIFFKKIFGKTVETTKSLTSATKNAILDPPWPPRGMVIVHPRCQKSWFRSQKRKIARAAHHCNFDTDQTCTSFSFRESVYCGSVVPRVASQMKYFLRRRGAPLTYFFHCPVSKIWDILVCPGSYLRGWRVWFLPWIPKTISASLRWPYKFIFLYGHGQFTWPFPTVTIRCCAWIHSEKLGFWIFLYFSMFFSPP